MYRFTLSGSGVETMLCRGDFLRRRKRLGEITQVINILE